MEISNPPDSGAKSNIDPSLLWSFCESKQRLSFLLFARNLGLAKQGRCLCQKGRGLCSEERSG